MLNEDKILFKGINFFRHLLTEGVDQNDIEQYINNHEYIYIYYGGDDNNKKGYRTIRPYVLGTNNNGDFLLRAWQDRGKSNSFSSPNARPEHEFWNEGGKVPGWRMFRLDKIEKVYPTGKKFNNSDGTVMIPPKYREGADKNMASVLAYVSTKTEPNFVPREVTPPTGEKITKWNNFNRGNKNNRKITEKDVNILRDIASRIYKKNRGNFLVVINNNNDFDLIDIKDQHKVPEMAVVGRLTNLYDTLVKKNEPVDDNFFNKHKENVKNQINHKQLEIKETELPTIPFNRKPFFKQ